MQPSPEPPPAPAADDGALPRGAVPRARTGARGRDPVDVAIEQQVARLANLVLNAVALAERYEDRLDRLVAATPDVPEQRARLQVLHAAADRGRSALIALSA